MQSSPLGRTSPSSMRRRFVERVRWRSMPYVFFASYARADDNKSSKMGRVFEELRERVGAKPGAGATGGIAYVDSTDIRTGEEGQKLLVVEVHETPVLLGMMGPACLTSEWCGREFEIFRR